MRTHRPLLAILLALVALAAAGCGGGGKEEELARLKAENEALKSQLAPSGPTGESAPLDAPVESAPVGDDWSWATGAPTTPSSPSSGSAPSDEPRSVPMPPQETEVEAPKPKPPKPKPQPKPEPEPEPEQPVNILAPAPAPQPVTVTRTVAAGTNLPLTLSNGVSSETSQVGDPVEAVLSSDVVDAEGRVILPAGTRVVGKVTAVTPAKKMEKKSHLAFHFSEAQLPDGSVVEVHAGRALEGKGWTKKDGAIIGGSAAGGALLGQVLGKDTESTVAGAVIGGAIGAGARAAKKGEDVGVEAGTTLDLPLETDVIVQRQELPPTTAP